MKIFINLWNGVSNVNIRDLVKFHTKHKKEVNNDIIKTTS